MLFHLSPLDGGNVFHTLNNNTLKELQKSKKAVWFYYKFYKERLDTSVGNDLQSQTWETVALKSTK